MRIPGWFAGPYGAAALLMLVLLALGGAALRPGGVWLGLPSPTGALAACLGLGVLLLWRPSRDALSSGVGWASPAVLLVAGVPLAAVRALSGPVLLVFVAAALVVALAALGRRSPQILFLPLVFLLFVCAGARSSVRVGPQGDEPHYLMVADSLLRDHDVSLERDYAEGRYASFHDAPLQPHHRGVRGRHGEVYSLHAVGLSVLILPAWALAGYPGVTVFLALVAALLVNELRGWVAELTGREGLAQAAAWTCALSPPLLHYAGLVFTEVPAALALSYGLRRGHRQQLGLADAIGVGLAAAALPWLNVRYAPLSLLVVAHAAWRRRDPPRLAALLAPLVTSAVGVGLYHHALYGFWDPRRVYGTRPEFSFATLGVGLPGLLLDQEFGLLVYAPVLALALPGIVELWRRERRLAVTAAVVVAVVVLTAGSWHMWRGGFNPPGRFLVPIVPLLFVGVALVWDRCGLTAGAALLVGWGLWTGLGGALEPGLVHRDRDGSAPFFRAFSGAHEWTGMLPRYVLEEPDRSRLAAVWALALLAAIPWRARRVTAGRTAIAALGLLAFAEAGALLGRDEAEERDAVRVIGRAALAAPGWSLVRSAAGEWSPLALGWGPLYEPHRHPEGVPLGRRLTLPPGRYRLDLQCEALAGALDSVRLEWSADRPGAVWRPMRLEPNPRGWAGVFETTGGDLNLRLREGPPFLLQRLRLSAQPSGPGPV